MKEFSLRKYTEEVDRLLDETGSLIEEYITELRSKEEIVESFKRLLDETILQHPFKLKSE